VIGKRIYHRVVCEPAKSFSPKMIIGSSVGEIYLAAWEGYDYNQGAVINSETMQPEHYASVHDGPIISVEGNPFLNDTFISIGGNVFALWQEDYRHAPIFWRHRPSKLTALHWSLDRPSVFFLTCENGSLEIWDLNSKFVGIFLVLI
jgi:WD40 repeat protein